MERKVCDLKGCCFEITFYFLRSCRYTLQLLCVFLFLSVSTQTSFFSFFSFFLLFFVVGEDWCFFYQVIFENYLYLCAMGNCFVI